MKIKLIGAIIIASSLTVQAQKTSVKSIDGTNYAVIIASDRAPSGFETRKDNDLYYNSKLYIFNGTSTPPLATYSAKKLVRHGALSGSHYNDNTSWAYKSYNPNKRVSEVFAISPVDVWSDGGTKINNNPSPMQNSISMTWAIANGLLESANSVGIDSEIPAQTTGCYMYKGANGTDPEGTWRLPTQRELQLINVLHIPLSAIQDNTSFTPLSSNYYWAATESGKTAAYVVNFSVGVTHISQKHNNYKLRCVRDIK